MPSYGNLSDVPLWVPKGGVNPGSTFGQFQLAHGSGGYGSVPSGTDPSTGSIYYQGRSIPYAQFQAQYPQQFADWQKSSGGGVGVPAGQPGSSYPAALPANSFEQSITDLKAAQDEAKQKNEARYGQALKLADKKSALVDSSFAGINARTAANATATDAELGGVYKTLSDRVGAVGSGYDQALSDVEGVGQRATEEVSRQQASADATSDSSLRSRGLFNSTVTDAGRRRDAEVGNRGRADVAENVAQLKSGITQNKTNAVSGAYGDLANFGLQRAGLNQTNRMQANTDARDYLSGGYQALSDKTGIIASRQDNAPSPTDIATLISNHEVGQQTAQAQREASDNSLFGSIFGGLGSLGGTLGSAAILAPALSDKNTKKDIKPTGRKDPTTGAPVKRWRYTDAVVKSGKGAPGRFEGPMAQDVEKRAPGRVVKGRDGYKRLIGMAPLKVG